jgi:GNAT superfamily N-acetyltransferase
MSVELAILPAREESVPAINALITRSKGYWTWPVGYLEQALALLTIDVDYLRTHQSFEVLDARSDLVSFVAIAVLDPSVVLDHLWVTPERIGRGIGRRACEYVIQFARDHQWSELSVLPDPPSERFYLRMGFENSGKRVPSRVRGGPRFSVYRLRL